jgi:hypothetical protein
VADVALTMLAAIDRASFFLGIATLIILVGGVLGALGQIGRAWAWAMQRFRPPPPRVELESLGGTHSSERDEASGGLTWHSVRPSFAICNDEPVAVYAVTGGIVGPDDQRIRHPQQPSIVRAESEFAFGSTDAFQIPTNWLPPFAADLNPHQAVRYFVELTDSNRRRWEGVIDFGEEVRRLRFRRVRKRSR